MINLENNYLPSEKDNVLLDKFEEMLLNQNIYYPFQPMKHINQEFINFISSLGRDLLTDFAVKSKSRQVIFNRLMNISYQYLAKNNVAIDNYALSQNWINLINVTYCNYGIDINMASLLEKVEEANKMFS